MAPGMLAVLDCAGKLDVAWFFFGHWEMGRL